MAISETKTTSTTQPATLKMEPDPGFKMTFAGMVVTEELGRPFEAELDVASAKRSGDLAKLLGTSVTVVIRLPGGGSRYFNGVVARANYSGMTSGAYRYRLELRPWIWLLSRVRDCAIYQNLSAWQIMTQIFRQAGFTFEDKRQSQSGDVVLDYCVQFEETQFDFVTRLMEKYGIYYFSTHEDGHHKLVFADDPNSHTSIGKAIPYRFEQAEVRRVEDHVWEWSVDLALQSGKVTHRDYNFLTPSLSLEAKSVAASGAPTDSYEAYDYPGQYGTADDGQKVATVRMQSIAARNEVLRGTTNARGMVTGGKFTLSENPDAAQNREYLVVATTMTYTLSEGRADQRGDALDQFETSLVAIPGTTPYRLEQLTPWPRMRGPQTARVVGKSGDEITTDAYGRIKVQFFWDRLGKSDENSSCWIRVSQTWAGLGWGGMVIPRIGQEVIVDYLDGNPDRPIVTGCVYNATNTVPYALDANKTRSTFKTNSSSGGGGFNELRFEDKKGEEEVFFQAQKDYNVVVLNNETVKITQDFTTTVDKGNRATTVSTGNDTLTVSKGDRSVTVSQGNESLTVSQGNRSVTVSQGNDSHTVSTGNRSATISQGNDSVTVSLGNHSIEVDVGSSTITAKQSITLQVGANSIVIDTSGITINGAKIAASATGQFQASAGGSMTLQALSIALN
jgi:type VI secretion system secreted protein VgrG